LHMDNSAAPRPGGSRCEPSQACRCERFLARCLVLDRNVWAERRLAENRNRGAGHRSLVAFGPIEKIQRGIDLLKLMFNLASLVGVVCQLKLLDEFVLPRVQVAYDC
jgi:hypothetical protein